MSTRAFKDRKVKAVFDAYGPGVRKPLLAMRELIFRTAHAAPAVGDLVEALKWGQPAYLPAKPRIGSTIRLGALPNGGFALFVHCKTDPAEAFRQIYPGLFRYEGDRALVFAAGEALPEAPLAHCIELSLTYHSRRRSLV